MPVDVAETVPRPLYPSVEELGLTEGDLRLFGVSREAADRFIRWRLGGEGRHADGSPVALVGSQTIVTTLTQRADAWAREQWRRRYGQ